MQIQYIPPDVFIPQVERWLLRACEALESFWDDEEQNFWRDSFEKTSDTATDERPNGLGRGKGATSNNRSFQAMVAALNYLVENPSDANADLRVSFAQKISEMANGYFSNDLDSLRDHGENRVNPYTDAQLLLSLCLAVSPVTLANARFGYSPEAESALLEKIATLGSRIGTQQLSGTGVSVDEQARPHHFLTLHSVRALDAANRTLVSYRKDVPPGIDIEDEDNGYYGALLDTVRREIVHQLGLHLLPAPGFDSASLVSCCALLSRFTRDADSPLLQRCIDALGSDQSERGTWTSAGVIGFDRRRLVYVPSVELSLVLSNLALLDLKEGELDIFSRAWTSFEGSMTLVQSSFSRHEGRSGWRNDRAQSGQQVESWTTAVVVRFLVSLRQTVAAAQQEQLLERYRATRPTSGFQAFWADLDALIPEPERAYRIREHAVSPDRIREFAAITDPTENNTIVNTIIEEILEPCLCDANERPVETASFLLFGPPGTRKTSLVERMAADLRWPLITLSPPAFLGDGIEGFESKADQIFEDLASLRRVVVLFDECEDFFRARQTPEHPESRTVGAFITSGMLPRLQRLRDGRWVVFVINTNIEAHELDPAVTRRGRLDSVARVGFPVLEAQLRYLGLWRSRRTGIPLAGQHFEWFKFVLGEVEADVKPLRNALRDERQAAENDSPDRGREYLEAMSEIKKDEAKKLRRTVTFSMLDDLASRCLGEGTATPITSALSLAENLEQEFERFGPDRMDRRE